MVRLLLRLGPYALLAAIAAGLAATWDQLPARYPVHWGVGGVDRWADLSPRSVGMPLLMGAIAVAWLGLLRRFTLANSAPAPDPARARKLLVAVTIGTQWLMAILFGLAAVPRQGPGLVVAGAGLGMLFLPVALIVTFAGKAPPAAPPVPAPPDGWLFVQRKDGTGLRIDPRHPRFWQAVVVLAAGPLAIIAVGMVG
ncbi:MAG: DUF1648 domain-containing protein [Deltaproteobacteria bacterium]